LSDASHISTQINEISWNPQNSAVTHLMPRSKSNHPTLARAVANESLDFVAFVNLTSEGVMMRTYSGKRKWKRIGLAACVLAGCLGFGPGPANALQAYQIKEKG